MYTSPKTSSTVWKETKDDWKKVQLPYVISAQFGGKYILQIDLLPFSKAGKVSKDGKASEITPYFSLVIDGNYNVSIKINNIPNSKDYRDQDGRFIVNISETVINHFLTLSNIRNNGSVHYLEVYKLGLAILPLIKHNIEGNIDKKLGYNLRIASLTEYDTLETMSKVVSSCPLTKAILSDIKGYLATLPKPEVKEVSLKSDDPNIVDHHKEALENQTTTNPTVRSDNTANEVNSLPPVTTFDGDIKQETTQPSTKAQFKAELTKMGVTFTDRDNLDKLTKLYNDNLVTV